MVINECGGRKYRTTCSCHFAPPTQVPCPFSSDTGDMIKVQQNKKVRIRVTCLFRHEPEKSLPSAGDNTPLGLSIQSITVHPSTSSAYHAYPIPSHKTQDKHLNTNTNQTPNEKYKSAASRLIPPTALHRPLRSRQSHSSTAPAQFAPHHL